MRNINPAFLYVNLAFFQFFFIIVSGGATS